MRVGLLLPLLLVLGWAAAAQPGAGAGAGGLEAVASGTGVHVRWTPERAGDEVVLVASHRDAQGAQVVDWARRLSANGTGAVEVVLENLPAGDLGIDVWDADGWPASAVSGATSLVEPLPAGLGAERSVEVTAPPRDAARAFQAYPVSDERADERDAHVDVTVGGAIVATWSQLDYDALPDCTIRVAASLDGGHTFSPPVEVVRRATSDARRPCEAVHHWAAAPLESGLVAIAWDDAEDEAPARMALYDPTTGSLLAEPALLPEVRFLNRAAAVSDGLGGFILAASTGLDGTMAAWRVDASGAALRLPALHEPGGTPYSLYGTSNGRGDVAFVWTDASARTGSDGGYRVWVSRSSDGGRTFAPATQLALPPQLQIDLLAARMSTSGTLHLAYSDYAEGTSTYVRVPASGPLSTLPLCGDQGASVLPGCDRAQYPQLAASGDQVWLLFERFEESIDPQSRDAVLYVATQSDTDGRSFEEPYRLEDRLGEEISTPYDMTVFGDGRPLLYGFFHFGSGEVRTSKHAVVPFFDQGAPAVLVLNATAAPAVPPPAATPWEFERAEAAAGAAGLDLRVRNLGGETWRDVTLEARDAATGEPVGRLDVPAVAPGGRVAGLLEGSPAVGSTGKTEVRLMVEGRLLGHVVADLPPPPAAASSSSSSAEVERLPDTTAAPGGRGAPAAGGAAVALALAALALARRRAGP